MEGDDNKNCSCAAMLNRMKDMEDEIERLKQMPKGSGGGNRVKRAPSEYNIFIGQCMKQGKGMKQCAEEYKREKK